MLPLATVPAAGEPVTVPCCPEGGGARGREGGPGRAKEPPRDAAAGLAEVLAMPAIWKDAAGNLLELPGPGGGIVVCGALPGAAAPVPAWTAEGLAAAGVAAEPGRVRDGTGLGLVSCVISPALLDAALAGVPGRRARKITPPLAMQLSLARGLEPGTAPSVLRQMAQRPREADPGYDLPAASSLSDADAFLQVKPFLRLLASLCGQVRLVPLPGVRPVFPAPGTPDGDRTAVRLRPLARPGGPWRDGRWHGLRVLAKDGTVRTVADPKGADRKGEHGQSRNAAHFGRPASTGAPAAPQARMVEVTDVWYRAAVAWAAGPCRTGETTLAAHLEPAYGPDDLDLADRGFPSSQAVTAKITAGKHFAWRVSSAWKLRRCGRPLADGTWKAAITWRGRTVKVRVIEYHMDQVFGLPPGHPLLAAPPPGVSVRVLPGDGGAACEQPEDGTIRVEVSETVTIITSLMDTIAYPARDIAELYGMRWASELVYLEEKQNPVRRAARHRGHPGRGVPDGRRHRRRPPGTPDRRRRDRRGDRRRARPDQRHRAARHRHREHPRRPGRHHHGPERRDRHHPPRHHPAPAAVRHRLAARTALPPVHHQESPDPQKQARRPRRDPAAPAPAARHGLCAAERAARRLTATPPARPGTAAPGPWHAPAARNNRSNAAHREQEPQHPLARTGLTQRNRNSSRAARTRPHRWLHNVTALQSQQGNHPAEAIHNRTTECQCVLPYGESGWTMGLK